MTLDNADRLTVMAIAGEIDKLGPRHDSKPDFSSFRKPSVELCAAILRPNELTSTDLRQHLVQIDEDRLKHVFAATIEANQPMVSLVGKPFKRDNGLCRSEI